MTSPTSVARMIDQRRPPLPRIGVVTATGAAGVTVAFSDGTTTPSLQYATAYVPTVGDQVLVIPTTTAWVVQGKVSAAPSLVPDEEIRVASSSGWYLARPVNWGSQTWARTDSSGPLEAWSQGRQILAQGSTIELLPQLMTLHASIGYYGALSALVPSGSTVTGVSMLLRRVATGAPEPTLASPVLYAHAYTPGSPPPAADPVFTMGPYRYPPVVMGETTRLPIPAAVVTAWLAGSVTGLALWSDQAADAFNGLLVDGVDVRVTYTPPA